MVVLNPAVIAEINEFIKRIFNALNSANLDQTKALFRLKATEQATAYGIPLSQRLEDQDSFFREWFNGSGWKMEPIDYERLDYGIYAGGQVVQVRYGDGSDVLRSAPDNDENDKVSFPLLISKIDGQWTVVR